MKESGRLQLGRNLLDGLLDIRGPPCACAHELSASEEEDDDLRFIDPVHEAGELLRFVFDLASTEGDRDRVQVDLRREIRRRDDVLDHDLGVLVHRDAGRPDLLRHEVDRGLHVLEPLGPRTNDLPTPEEQDRGLRLLETIDQSRELLRLVLRPAEDEGDRLQVELLPEGSRRDDVLKLVVRRRNTTEGRRRGTRHRLRPDAASPLYSPGSPRAFSGLRTNLRGRSPRFRIAPVGLDPPTVSEDAIILGSGGESGGRTVSSKVRDTNPFMSRWKGEGSSTWY